MRHFGPPVAADQHRRRQGGFAVAPAHLVDRLSTAGGCPPNGSISCWAPLRSIPDTANPTSVSPRSAIRGAADGDQLPRGGQNGLRRRGGPRQGARSGGPAEVVEPQAQHHRSPAAPGGAHPGGDPVDQVDYYRVDFGGRHAITGAAQRPLSTDRPAPHAGGDPAAVDVVRQRKQLTSHRGTQSANRASTR